MPTKDLTVEDMLAALERVDVRLAPGRKVEDITSEWGREEIEADGWEFMLVAMGGEALNPETNQSIGIVSEDVWHFDTECIYGDGDYTRIVDRICRMSAGDLLLDDVQDHVDIEAREAWIEWTSKEGRTRHNLRVTDDWVDTKIFELLEAQLIAQGSARRLMSVSMAQDALVFCVSPERRDELSRLTQLEIGNAV